MNLLGSVARTLAKMFAADLVLTALALATVLISAFALRWGAIPSAAAPFLLGGGVLGALVIGVLRGARR